MKKGEQTREMIIAQSALLFNTKGYAAVSISAVMEATGLEKGGIYRHFDGKDALARAAFVHNTDQMGRRLAAALAGRGHPVDRLLTMLSLFQDIAHTPPVAGGCPILNTAVEADDTDEGLSDLARDALTRWEEAITTLLWSGQARGQVRLDIDPPEVAAVIIAALEGAIMMSRLRRENGPMARVIRHLTNYLNNAVRV